MKTGGDPFLFLGHGFGTSARCLECHAWFARPPGKRDRERIQRELPFPVASFARFDGALLHFGSDDDLEARVVAAYHPDYAGRDREEVVDELIASCEPRRAEWTAFCSDFEQAMRRVHDRNALFAVIKPDDGAYGRRPSAWHRRSLRRAEELAELAASSSSKPRDAWSGLAKNLREEAARAAKRGGSVRRGAAGAKRPASAHRARASGKADGKALLRAALDTLVVPRLRESGFEGSSPRFRRITRSRTHVVWFELEAGEYASVNVGLAALPPRKDTSLKEDYDRAFSIRNRHRWRLLDLVGQDERSLFWYENAAAKWGAAWPEELARFILRALETRGGSLFSPE